MDDDTDFVPRLGRPRGRGKDARYLSLVIKAARRAGRRTGVRSRRFDGSRIGRGAGVARVLRSGDRHAAFRAAAIATAGRYAADTIVPMYEAVYHEVLTGADRGR